MSLAARGPIPDMLAISKVDADFALAQYHQDGIITYSSAGSSNSLNCHCWETGPQVFDSNHIDFFSLPGGLCGVEEQLDFYYGARFLAVHNGNGMSLGWCNYDTVKDWCIFVGFSLRAY